MSNGISRRNFLKGATSGAAVLAALNMVGCASSSASGSTAAAGAQTGAASFNFADSIAWNAEYDVVVVGFGGAGAVASITAAEEGAKVLLIEKAPKGLEGGNTRISCNFMAGVADPDKYLEKVIKHNNYLYTDTVDEDTLRAAAQAMSENVQWLENHGAVISQVAVNEDTGSFFLDFDPGRL